MAESYIPPDKVISPKRSWVLVSVLADFGEEDTALAIGRWDGQPSLGIRWNGSEDNPIGNPQSRGLPIWFVVPSRFRQAIIDELTKIDDPKVKLTRDMKAFVQNFFS
jgi:hypothetical protein